MNFGPRLERDVLLDQLAALLHHAEECDTPDCPECARLDEALEAAKDPLNKPFRR